MGYYVGFVAVARLGQSSHTPATACRAESIVITRMIDWLSRLWTNSSALSVRAPPAARSVALSCGSVSFVQPYRSRRGPETE